MLRLTSYNFRELIQNVDVEELVPNVADAVKVFELILKKNINFKIKFPTLDHANASIGIIVDS